MRLSGLVVRNGKSLLEPWVFSLPTANKLIGRIAVRGSSWLVLLYRQRFWSSSVVYGTRPPQCDAAKAAKIVLTQTTPRRLHCSYRTSGGFRVTTSAGPRNMSGNALCAAWRSSLMPKRAHISCSCLQLTTANRFGVGSLSSCWTAMEVTTRGDSCITSGLRY